MKLKLVDLYDFKYPRYENIDKIIDNKFQYAVMEVIAGDIGYIHDVLHVLPTNRIQPDRFRKYFDKLSKVSRESFQITFGALNALLEIQIEVNELIRMTRNELEKQ